jgi:hypothetical protein
MRYIPVDTESFTNAQGKTVNIKTMREYPSYEVRTTIKVKSEDKLDEIATRQEVFGEGNELLSYKLFELNRVVLMEKRFDMNKIGKLEIPL